jgi:catechol 2,3-dioxygenase-like lactoylglutathione lyase family enzyme
VHRLLAAAATLLLTGGTASTAVAQILVAGQGPVVYGHHHLAVSDVAAHKKFWIETLGGTLVTIPGSGTEAIRFPNVYLLMRAQAPTGGSKGTSVNHLGFSVPSLRPVIDRIKANGFRMVTSTEVAPTQAVTDDIAVLGPNAAIAFALGPDDVKIELVESRAQTQPIALHHVHFFGPQNEEMRAWYARVFGAQPRPGGGAFLSATLPGVLLNFTASPDPVVGTRGRAIDHIGFEIDNLEAFTKRLVAEGITLDVPYTQVPKTKLFIAFITDPWGTSIELSEGLDTLP